MDANPYRSPQVADDVGLGGDPVVQRSWLRTAIGAACIGIAVLVVAIYLSERGMGVGRWMLIARSAVDGWMVLSLVTMAGGMFLRRDKLALAGFAMLVAPLAVTGAMSFLK